MAVEDASAIKLDRGERNIPREGSKKSEKREVELKLLIDGAYQIYS